MTSTSQFVKVHACGGKHAGRHKRSFQRLPGADAAPAARSALSASELRSALAPAPVAHAVAPAPVAQRAAAPSKQPAPKATPAAAADDPWSRLFRRAAGVERDDDVSDVEDAAATAAQVEEEELPPAPPPVTLAPAPEVRVMPSMLAPSRAAGKQDAPPAPERRAATRPSASMPPAEPQQLSGAELDAVIDAERQAQLRVLVRAAMPCAMY